MYVTLKSWDTSNSSWESIASDRLQWRHLCHSSLVQFENNRIASLDDRRSRRKNQARASNPTVNNFCCVTCGRTCYVADRHVRPSKAVQRYFRHGSSIACHRQCQLYFHVFIYTSIYLLYLWTYVYIPYWNVCSSSVRLIESDDSVWSMCVCMYVYLCIQTYIHI